jgi:hypothetical protein
MLEKRKWPRIACLERCNVHPVVDETRPRLSRILNYSFNGLMLEMDSPLRQGEQIMVRMQDRPTDSVLSCVEKRVGTVRWCSGSPQRFSGCYELGVEMPGLVPDEMPVRRARS